MGLIKFQRFSSIPTLSKRVSQKTKQLEDVDTRIPKTFIEFIQEKGTRIVRNTFVGGASAALFTVPTDKLFYLISIGCGYTNLINAANKQASLEAETSIGTETLAIVRSAKLDAFGIVLNLVPALRFVAGDVFNIVSDTANFIAVGNIIGFEIDRKFVEQRF